MNLNRKIKPPLTFEQWAKIENRKIFWRNLLYSPIRFYYYINPPEIKYSKISKYGDLFTLKEFQEDCFTHGIMDSDGCGLYCVDGKETNVDASPSDIMMGKIRTEFTHVVWFNK